MEADWHKESQFHVKTDLVSKQLRGRGALQLVKKICHISVCLFQNNPTPLPVLSQFDQVYNPPVYFLKIQSNIKSPLCLSFPIRIVFQVSPTKTCTNLGFVSPCI